ncbi:MAG: type II toxin-antitoxin system VapC family toxin [Patescibacteria group bacterium]|nr:type II toxin-antitoxin system VapC family toxin [Patescibacteria group bacterium]
MKAYLDSSAFAKRYIDESGSDTVEAICGQASALGLSVICVPEIISALNRRRRERAITPKQYDEVKQRLLDDVRDVEIIGLTIPVVATAVGLLEANSLRTLDALHVACAIEWGAQLFLTSDKRQLAAARQAGLKTCEA